MYKEYLLQHGPGQHRAGLHPHAGQEERPGGARLPRHEAEGPQDRGGGKTQENNPSAAAELFTAEMVRTGVKYVGKN